MRTAGAIRDSSIALRRLLTALDSAAYALNAARDTELSARLAEDATRVMQHLEELERADEYRAAREEYLNND